MIPVPLNDETAVVDLQSEAEARQEDNQPLISALSSAGSLKKWIAAAVIMLVCISGITLLILWQSQASVPSPIPVTTMRPSPIPTVRPLPANASDMSAESLLNLVFNPSQLVYTEIKCFPESPPTFKFMLQVENFANFTAESTTKVHARNAVTREAAHVMFDFDYEPVPPAPQACQLLQL